jgi:YegS/Rv2252/BmrU family lipid kinase
MKPPLLIVNPKSGMGRAAPAIGPMLAAVERTLGDVMIRYTARRGHARELAMEGTREGHPLIVAAGGDGTLSEVANGILAVTGSGTLASHAEPHSDGAIEEPVLALINMGTGGDFRRSLGIGSSYEDSLQAIALGRERLVDVGRASFVGTDGEPVDYYFVNVLSAGLSGLVVRYVDKAPSFLGGQVAYYLASLRGTAVAKERSFVARVTWEKETREEVIPAYLIAICNGRWFGGGMDVAPMALPDDGRFEVLTVTERSRIHIAVQIRKVYSGRHLEIPTVHHFPCHRIELRMADEALNRRVPLEVDGEPLGSLPLAVEILPRRLRIRA